MELAALNCNTFPLLRLFPLEVVQYYSASSSLVQRKPVSRKKADDVVQIFDYTGYYQILFPCITGTYFIKEKVIFPVVLQHS